MRRMEVLRGVDGPLSGRAEAVPAGQQLEQ